MEALTDYQGALALYEAHRYEEALSRVAHMRGYISRWLQLDLLEAHLYFALGRYPSEIAFLCGALASLTTGGIAPEERGQAAELWSMLGSACHRLGLGREAVEAFLEAAHVEPNLAQKRVECSNAVFAANAIAGCRPEEYRRLYRRYAALLADIRPLPRRTYRHRRLRIGYLSADFRRHPLAQFFWAFLAQCDRERFAVYLYVANPSGSRDGVTQRLLAAADAWRDIAGCTDEEAAQQMYADELDILFDLSGHTSGNRLPILAYRPAAVQISGIGDVAGTGLSCVDYFWADRNTCRDGKAARDYFAERLTAGLTSSVCYTPLAPPPPAAPAPCLRRGYVTFGCFNNASKITDETLSLWSAILHRTAGSRLLLKHRLFDGAEGRTWMAERLARAGISPGRVELRGFSADYLAAYADVDIALDTYPYVGGVTTCEALYQGVPVITRYGVRYGTRIAYNILRNAGLEELAAAAPADYVERAAALAQDTELVALLHRRLRPMLQASPLMDTERFIREAEALYAQMVRMAQRESEE